MEIQRPRASELGLLNASCPVSLLPPTVPTTFASWRRLALRGLRPFVRRAREKRRVTVTRRVRRRAIAGAHRASHPQHLACRDAACRHVIAGSRVLSYLDPSTARAAPARPYGGPGLPVSAAFLQVGFNHSVSYGPSSRAPCQAHGPMGQCCCICIVGNRRGAAHLQIYAPRGGKKSLSGGAGGGWGLWAANRARALR
jgi:hypothetical protein